ncbi:hypothetical protein [Bosea thiooxidans]
MIDIVSEFVDFDRSINVSPEQILYRGVNLKHGERIETYTDRNVWVCRHIEGARRYSVAFDQSGLGSPKIIKFKPIRDISLVGLNLFGITKELCMRHHFDGAPQIYQRDSLLNFLEKIFSREFDGFYDYNTKEILVKIDLIRRVLV